MDSFERSLQLIPYLVHRPGVTISEIARDFKVKPHVIRDDLKRLWVECGLPGGAGGDLLDFQFYDDRVDVVFSAGLDKPLRLTGPEATALIIALEALAHSQPSIDTSAIMSAREKIEKIASSKRVSLHHKPRKDIHVAIERDSNSDFRARLAHVLYAAIERNVSVEISYYSPSSDLLTQRRIDPISLWQRGDHDYVQAWCHNAQGLRQFRLDRVDSVILLEDPQQYNNHAASPVDSPQVPSGPPKQVALVHVAATSRWIIDSYDLEVIAELPDGSAYARLEFFSIDWLIRWLLSLHHGVSLVLNEAEYSRVESVTNNNVAQQLLTTVNDTLAAYRSS